jgi:Tol biopolymer transport system component
VNTSALVRFSLLLGFLATALACGNTIFGPDPVYLPLNGEPSWSPDGNRIAYVHIGRTDEEIDQFGWHQIWVYSFSTDSTVHWTRGWNPTWSPDATQLAYIGEDGNLWVISEPDVANPVQITTSSVVWQPRWSPDGRRILFRRLDRSIYVIDAGGTNLTATGVSSASADFFFDETVMIFTGPSEKSFHTIRIGAPADSAALLSDIPAFARHLHARPHSGEIGYFRFGERRGRENGPWLMSTDPVGHRAIAIGAGDFSWAPDGERFVTEFIDETGTIDLWLMSLGSDDRERLLERAAPDGPGLLY